ncbi:MAG: nitroreductase family protein [bacterium]
MGLIPLIEAIMERRSVRFYEPKPVPRDIMQTIIQAGNLAPSGANAQQWRFVVVENEDFRKKLADLALPRYKRWIENAPEQFKAMRAEIDAVAHDPVYYSAPAIVFIIGTGMTADYDCPMVCENMMIAATSLGIGSCWVFFGQLVLNDQEVRNSLGLVEGEKVYGPILLGYPKENLPERASKKDPVIKWL